MPATGLSAGRLFSSDAMDNLTHTVSISVDGRYAHGQQQHCAVTISGDGSLDHMLEAFTAALVAAGFAAETAAKLRCEE